MMVAYYTGQTMPVEREEILQSHIPEDLHLQLMEYMQARPYAVWPDPHSPGLEYYDDDPNRTAPWHTLGFIHAKATELSQEGRNHGIDIVVLPRDLALQGLTDFYHGLRQNPEDKNAFYQQQVQNIRKYGNLYADPRILMHLHRGVRMHSQIPGLSFQRREYLLKSGLLDVAGALGMAIKTHHRRRNRLPETEEPEVNEEPSQTTHEASPPPAIAV